MNILIIGGNGYIGCRLYEYLKDEGYSVENADLCLFGKVFPDTLVCDYRSIPKSKIQEYSHIILLAGHSCPATIGDDTSPSLRNNVINFINLLDKISPNQKLIYASTAAIYGNTSKIMYENAHLADPVDFYTYTKQAIEAIARIYPSKNTIGLRFGTVSGFSKNFRQENLLNSMTIAALKNKEIIVSNPKLYRSVLGIDDLCFAIKEILVQGIKRPIYNLVSMRGTILKFGNDLAEYTNSNLIINSSMKTGYSFNCSSELFSEDYNFKFKNTVEDIYLDIVNNLDSIEINEKRSIIHYE